MFCLSVPFFLNNTKDATNFAEMLKSVGANRVFLVTECVDPNAQNYKAELELIREAINHYKSAGFEVGVWRSTIGHGGPLIHNVHSEDSSPFRLWMDLYGNTVEGNFCPCDENFLKATEQWMRDVSTLAPDMIMIDDDFRTTMRGEAPGCICDWHLAEYNRRVGEKLTREEIVKKVFCGAPNRYRDEWFKMQGESLYNMARRLRAAVDSVNKNVRLGQCLCPTSWDFEGSDPRELSKILAGGTRPFMRLTGSVYWCKHDYARLSEIIETERLMAHWCKDENIEIFAEGDTYPRPRFAVPAAFLEQFDLCLRADGSQNGILKYMIDYVSYPDYETGYLNLHKRNMPLYENVHKMFEGKKAVGLQVFQPPQTFHLKEMPEEMTVDGWYGWNFTPAPVQRFIANAGIPTAFNDGDNALILFDEAAYFLTEEQRKKGVILNITAAEILRKQGIDVGFTQIKRVGSPTKEFFFDENQPVCMNVHSCDSVYDLELKEGVRQLSQFTVDGKKVTGVCEYENADGERFVILPFEKGNGDIGRNYCRQRQLAKSAAWAARRPLPAFCAGHPELYIMCKTDEKSLTIGLWNNGPDPIFSPSVTLAQGGKVVKTLQCEANVTNNTLNLSTDISAFGFAAITIKLD